MCIKRLNRRVLTLPFPRWWISWYLMKVVWCAHSPCALCVHDTICIGVWLRDRPRCLTGMGPPSVGIRTSFMLCLSYLLTWWNWMVWFIFIEGISILLNLCLSPPFSLSFYPSFYPSLHSNLPVSILPSAPPLIHNHIHTVFFLFFPSSNFLFFESMPPTHR